jgi:rhamnosyltransferase
VIKIKNIIIIGARGYKASYGGWETFVTNLVENYKDKNTKFHIPELTNDKSNKNKIIKKDDVSCLQVYSPRLGFVTMFIYAIKALFKINKYIKKEHLENPTIYVLGCRMGPFYPFLVHPLKKRGIKVYLNPDGLEWKREKWSWWIKECFKISEYIMVKYSDAIVSDSKAIKDYIDTKYKKFNKESHFIAYGAYLDTLGIKDNELFKKYQIKENNYYLIVGRFVPENNYELIIKEFMKTNTKKDLVIVSNIEENKFYNELKEKTNFQSDKRIKFIGSVYNKESLIYIRENAYAYIHGHSAGGTNPSLLEALATTKVNILFNAIYNVEVGMTSSLYFSKKENDLKKIIECVDSFDEKMINKYSKLAKDRIKKEYTWDIIVNKYKKLWK